MNWRKVGGADGFASSYIALDSAVIAAEPSLWSLRSTDNGATWQRIYFRDSLAVSPPFATDGRIIYGTVDFPLESGKREIERTRGIVRSNDKGATWQLVAEIDSLVEFTTMTVQQGIIYTSSESVFNGYIQVSNTGNVSRQNLGRIISVLSSNGRTLLYSSRFDSSLYRSTNSGNSWSQVAIAKNIIGRIKCFVALGSTLYAGTTTGLFRSDDDGQTWTKVILRGATYCTALAARGSILIASTDVGLFRIDGGSNSGRNISFEQGINSVSSIAIADDNANILLTSNCITRNGGSTWSRINFKQDLRSNSYSFVKTDDSTLYGFYDRGLEAVVESKRFDQIEWRPHLENRSSIVSERNNVVYLLNSLVFIGTVNGKIYRGDNQTKTWRTANTGLVNQSIYDMTHIGNTLFVGTQASGVLRTTDSGATWVRTNLPQDISLTWALAARKNTLFVGSGGNGVYRSSDSGTTWTQVNNGLRSRFVEKLGVTDCEVFASTAEGVFVTSDDGNSWIPMNRGLENQVVRSFAKHRRTMFVSTDRGEVYRLNFGCGRWLKVSERSSLTVNFLDVRNDTLFAATNNGIWRADIIADECVEEGTCSSLSQIMPERLSTDPGGIIFAPIRQFARNEESKVLFLLGSNLLSPVTITAPLGILIWDATTNTWRNQLTLPFSFNLSRGLFISVDSSRIMNVQESIRVANSTITRFVSVYRKVVPRPQLIVTPLEPSSDFGAPLIQFDPSPKRTYTLNGRFLDASVNIIAPDGILLFDRRRNLWASTMTIPPQADSTITETIIVRIDSARIGAVRDSVRHSTVSVSGTTSASIAVTGSVTTLTLPQGAETNLEMRLIGQQPFRNGDTVRLQIWLRSSRLLSPRLIGRFASVLRTTIRIDTNSLAVLGIAPETPRARLEMPSLLPSRTAQYTILAERVDSVAIENLLLAEIRLVATLGNTTTNTIRFAEPTHWLTATGTSVSLNDIAVNVSAPVSVQIRPLFRQRSAILTLAPNPAIGSVEVVYNLQNPENLASVPLTLLLHDVEGRVIKRLELGQRRIGVELREVISLAGMSAGAYYVVLQSPLESLSWRIDIVR